MNKNWLNFINQVIEPYPGLYFILSMTLPGFICVYFIFPNPIELGLLIVPFSIALSIIQYWLIALLLYPKKILHLDFDQSTDELIKEIESESSEIKSWGNQLEQIQSNANFSGKINKPDKERKALHFLLLEVKEAEKRFLKYKNKARILKKAGEELLMLLLLVFINVYLVLLSKDYFPQFTDIFKALFDTTIAYNSAINNAGKIQLFFWQIVACLTLLKGLFVLGRPIIQKIRGYIHFAMMRSSENKDL